MAVSSAISLAATLPILRAIFCHFECFLNKRLPEIDHTILQSTQVYPTNETAAAFVS
jgi:hypothetical protein